MRRISGGLVALVLAFCGNAFAGDPGYYVVTVYSQPEQWTADLRYWTVQLPGAGLITWPEAGIGYTVNSRWYTELLASFVGSSDSGTRLNKLEWQNDVLLTQGQYPFDLAIHSLLVSPQNPTGGYGVELGPVLQTDIGRTQLNLNAFFDRGFGAIAKPTQLKYQWQVRYRWVPWLNVGAQGFGELGTWNDWAPQRKQSHRAGPAIFGSARIGTNVVGWQAAYLVGKTFGSHADMLTTRLKVDF